MSRSHGLREGAAASSLNLKTKIRFFSFVQIFVFLFFFNATKSEVAVALYLNQFNCPLTDLQTQLPVLTLGGLCTVTTLGHKRVQRVISVFVLLLIGCVPVDSVSADNFL